MSDIDKIFLTLNLMNNFKHECFNTIYWNTRQATTLKKFFPRKIIFSVSINFNQCYAWLFFSQEATPWKNKIQDYFFRFWFHSEEAVIKLELFEIKFTLIFLLFIYFFMKIYYKILIFNNNSLLNESSQVLTRIHRYAIENSRFK